MTPVNETLNKVVCINLDIRLWTGRKKLNLNDLRNVDGSSIPPGDLASLGSKKIIDSRELTKFHGPYRKAERLLSNEGVRFLGGYAIPEDRLPHVRSELNRLRDDFLQTKMEFITNYDKLIEDWAARHPEWESIIRNSVTPISHVQNTLQFEWQAFRVTTPQVKTEEGVADATGLGQETNNLSDRLFADVAEISQNAWDRSFAGKTEAKLRSLMPIRHILKKLRSLQFIHPSIVVVADQVETTLNSMPKSGPISGKDFSSIIELIYLLSDKDRMQRHAEGLVNQNPESDDDDDDSDITSDGDTDDGQEGGVSHLPFSYEEEEETETVSDNSASDEDTSTEETTEVDDSEDFNQESDVQEKQSLPVWF